MADIRNDNAAAPVADAPKSRKRYAVQSLMGRWGDFTRRKDAEAAAKRQREADRQAGNAPGNVRVVSTLSNYPQPPNDNASAPKPLPCEARSSASEAIAPDD